MFLMPSESHFYLSSRLIKEVAQLGGDVTRYVPAPVAAQIKKKFIKHRSASEMKFILSQFQEGVPSPVSRGPMTRKRSMSSSA